MPFISNTDKERQEMLTAIGVEKFSDLLKNIPQKFIVNKNCCLENQKSELEISHKFYKLIAKNISSARVNSFLGGGIYDHFIPAAVDHIIQRPEFHTAYTPYQAEVSQGTLQYIYEFQSMICELTGMEISNAGMYDGASATAEAILMAARKSKRDKAVIAASLNPLYKKVIQVYTEGMDIELVEVDIENDLQNLKKVVDNQTACVVVQSPNFFGNLEDMFAIEDITHSEKKTLFITVVDPISLAILNSPTEYNADIVVGEGQALGNPTNYGGPLFGFLATRSKLVRSMPGRIVGATVDANGNRCYSLTLQAREQHIRRAKATSNICSNDALCTLAATVYMSLMGPKGLNEVATQSATKAHYLATKIAELPNYNLASNKPFFKEFTLKTPIPAKEIINLLTKKDILAGISLEQFGMDKNLLLIAVTEKKSKAELDNFVNALKEVPNA
ncbi:MAG: aminomethyl-transferring glycine dehydrogenase subunit GcvPA [Candidatus Cloacimonadota bacterium]|nr:aminomethyl-transferring glycine dehydrogenase subunit GcvPA [Candidatus Cloacimonadota bacterium]